MTATAAENRTEAAKRHRIEGARVRLAVAASAMPADDPLRQIIEAALAEAEAPGARTRAPAPRDAAPPVDDGIRARSPAWPPDGMLDGVC